jgi:hypothetical protein
VNSTFIQGALDRIVAAMKKHRKAFWLVGHWFYVPSDRDDKTQTLVQERKSLCDSAKREYQHLLNELADEGFPQSILEEPGVWTYPVCSGTRAPRTRIASSTCPRNSRIVSCTRKIAAAFWSPRSTLKRRSPNDRVGVR